MVDAGREFELFIKFDSITSVRRFNSADDSQLYLLIGMNTAVRVLKEKRKACNRSFTLTVINNLIAYMMELRDMLRHQDTFGEATMSSDPGGSMCRVHDAITKLNKELTDIKRLQAEIEADLRQQWRRLWYSFNLLILILSVVAVLAYQLFSPKVADTLAVVVGFPFAAAWGVVFDHTRSKVDKLKDEAKTAAYTRRAASITRRTIQEHLLSAVYRITSST